MKKPEEIKKGLEACVAGECHSKRYDCPYRMEAECTMAITEDALAYIQQLEKHTHELMVRCAESTEMAALFVQANMARSPKGGAE